MYLEHIFNSYFNVKHHPDFTLKITTILMSHLGFTLYTKAWVFFLHWLGIFGGDYYKQIFSHCRIMLPQCVPGGRQTNKAATAKEQPVHSWDQSV